ncbi:MAG: hypothetical protein ACO3RV_04935, partial [Luteolibacter sp.]
SVGVSQQIYSLPPLATRAPTHGIALVVRAALLGVQMGFDKRKAAQWRKKPWLIECEMVA